MRRDQAVLASPVKRAGAIPKGFRNTSAGKTSSVLDHRLPVASLLRRNGCERASEMFESSVISLVPARRTGEFFMFPPDFSRRIWTKWNTAAEEKDDELNNEGFLILLEPTDFSYFHWILREDSKNGTQSQTKRIINRIKERFIILFFTLLRIICMHTLPYLYFEESGCFFNSWPPL